ISSFNRRVKHMVDRGKTKQARSLKEDRVSKLPDHLICHILSPLPIKEIIKTSLLSTRWRSLWLSVPYLDLNSQNFPHDFNAFVSFGDMFSSSGQISKVKKMFINPVTFNVVEDYFKNTRLDDLTDDISYFSPAVPRCFLSTLECVDIKNSIIMSSASEFLFLNVAFYFRASSTTLKKLILRFHSEDGANFRMAVVNKFMDIPRRYVDCEVLLFCLSIHDEKSKSFIVNNLEYNAKLEVYVTFGLKFVDEASVSSRKSLICSFLSGISKVEDLTIHEQTFRIIYNYSKSGLLSQFGYMSRLCVSLYSQYMKGLTDKSFA
ncbi:hypothetical protein CARUB_v10027540mg, partial [Capsella rubella]